MSEVVVAAQGLTFEVSNTVLVDDIDLEGHAGEVLAVVGPNGAGKSTLIGLLSGDLEPSGGNVVIRGTDIRKETPLGLAAVRSVMRQGSPRDIPFTAYSVVEMGRHPHRLNAAVGYDDDQDAIRSAMERTDTVHVASRVFATLSGGEQTRVVMARVLAQAAPLVLLDEPTTALDVAHQERLLSEIRALAGDGACVVAVLHDLNAAAYYADRIVLLDHGAIRAEGPPREVLNATLLSEVYGQPMTVIDHPTRCCPLVLTTDA